MELINTEQINTELKNSQYIVLTRDNKLSIAKSLMSNKNNINLIVSSNSPIFDKDGYTVVLQQQFGGNYLSLIKKVIEYIVRCKIL